MRPYNIFFGGVTLIVMAEDLSDLFDIMEKQEGFFIVADELFVNPFKNMLCQIEELPRRGIIHTESH